MTRTLDLLLTALAPTIWGSTYIVTTQWLPEGHPVTLAAMRALPAGLLLLLLVRTWPPVAWLPRLVILGAANFAVFWTLLFIAAHRLPGGVTATLGATQPLIVIGLARAWLGTPVRLAAVVAGVAGVFGVAVLVLGPDARLDSIGLMAGLGGALSMAIGTVLSRRWQPPVPALTFTAWQLTAGGFLLAPAAWMYEPVPPALGFPAVIAMTYLGLVGAALSYLLWFRGVARLDTPSVAMLGMMSPVSAVVLGWAIVGEQFSPLQQAAAGLVLGPVWVSQRSSLPPRSPAMARSQDRRATT
ncbi:EamA family transporter [Zhengella mangrovi]|uniref:EamA family transporter n=1 Tax=Zhengella mangrovi TaxID=1982044 RepID=A0A2G1QJV1_9HYPH|nr:EamA family transporter [Zhengella mangrovi]PHP65806.1 EamA family transporter [Zhengella mangrovi]